ncbi:MAG: hypothetical protein QF824_05200 [Candidatus Woesearchaeota archaeon]|jgi:hypothetical protein|nr:hypothetical protein [Candidatus Woesearchaeota archaeon]
MDDKLGKIRKKLKKEAEEGFEVDEDSDIPVHEKYVKEKKVKRIR